MHILSMQLSNWVCFAGLQPMIALRPLAYAVVAVKDGSADSSNWAGKSSFLRAPYFALYGEHAAKTEDGWLTHGAQEGGVELVIEGDEMLKVRRTRRRGKSTQLEVHTWKPNNTAATVTRKGEEAQRYLDGVLGLSSVDFQNTCYFEQKQLSRLVMAKPQERMDIVGAWLQLEPLVRAEELVRQELSGVSTRAADGRDAMRRAEEAIKVELGAAGERDGLMRDLGKADDHLSDLQAHLREKQQVYSEARKVAVQRSKIAEYDRIAQDGKDLVDQLAAMDLPALQRAAEEASRLERELGIAAGAVARDVQQKRVVAKGQFDGTCPVAAIDCPAKDQINKRRKAAQTALAESEQQHEEARGQHEEAVTTSRHHEAKRQEAERIKQRVDAMRDQIRQMHADVTAAKKGLGVELGLDVLESAQSLAQQRVLDQQGVVQTLKRSLDVVDRAIAEQARLRDGVAAAERELETLREAVLTFGKTGAQRRVAEQALRSIEDGANEGLRECGIDLSIEVQWSRQGDGLAKQCDACGQLFPSSAKVKRCERCNQERGPLLVQKLELVLSERSGAAEDLLGAAFQFSAAAWLRENRGSGWGVALVDEPFSAMDASNRRAFAVHLVQMLRNNGFQQSFTVSHTEDTVNMLPGRILIENQDGRATARVVG